MSIRVFLTALTLSWSSFAATDSMVRIPGGTFIPFYSSKKKISQKPQPISVKSFLADVYPVTNAQFLEFVRSSSDWRKSKVKQIFADKQYLKNWKSDLRLGKNAANRPVVFVSWFAAKSYCESKGKALPTTDQWEYLVQDNGNLQDAVKERALNWFSRPNSKEIPPVGSTFKNSFGAFDLVGLVWEWTEDFNDPDGDGSESFCGAGAGTAIDSSDYVKFMRFSFRNSLKANYSTANLGFRCVKEATE